MRGWLLHRALAFALVYATMLAAFAAGVLAEMDERSAKEIVEAGEELLGELVGEEPDIYLAYRIFLIYASRNLLVLLPGFGYALALSSSYSAGRVLKAEVVASGLDLRGYQAISSYVLMPAFQLWLVAYAISASEGLVLMLRLARERAKGEGMYLLLALLLSSSMLLVASTLEAISIISE